MRHIVTNVGGSYIPPIESIGLEPRVLNNVIPTHEAYWVGRGPPMLRRLLVITKDPG